MVDKAEAGELSAEETAYFEAEGETELETPEIVEEQEEQEQPEAKGDDKPDEEAGKVKTVPHQALHAEREEHRKTKAQLEEISRKQAILEDRWNTLLKFQQPDQKAQDDPAPNPDEDIFAYAKWQARQLEKVNSKLSEREKQEQQVQQQSQEDQAIYADWNRSVSEFSSQTADFKDAAGYLANLRMQQLSALGLSQAQINATIDNEVKGVVMQARQMGSNPAELIYNYAKASGYTGKKADDDAAKKVADIEAAQKAAKTIAGSGGKSGADPLTPDAIASMSQAEFDAWIQKPENERRFERMMGA
jgi:hypothetical protein